MTTGVEEAIETFEDERIERPVVCQNCRKPSLDKGLVGQKSTLLIEVAYSRTDTKLEALASVLLCPVCCFSPVDNEPENETEDDEWQD